MARDLLCALPLSWGRKKGSVHWGVTLDLQGFSRRVSAADLKPGAHGACPIFVAREQGTPSRFPWLVLDLLAIRASIAAKQKGTLPNSNVDPAQGFP